MANKLQLWVSAETGKLLAAPSSFVSAARQVFYAGDTLDLEVHLMQGVGVARVPYEVDFPAGSDLKVSVGTVATSPTGGNWRLSVSSTETADLPYNATPASIQSALNAIGAVAAAGGVNVISLGGGYSITWNTVGTKPDILAGSDTLVPASYQSIYVLQEGNATQQEIIFVELRQSPLALTDSFSAIGTPVVSSTVVSAWNGTNKVVRVSIDPIPKSGTYVIDVDGDSAAIQAFANEGQISALLSTSGITSVSSVTQSGVLTFDLVMTANVSVSVSGTGLVASPAKVGTISFATSELIAFLGSDATKDATIEVSVTSAGETRTLAQVACVVANAVIAPGAVSPVPVGVILTEAVANARYVRRDAAQSPSVADLDVIWPNLGVSADGSDVAAAISGANAPAAGNVFVTMSERNPFDQSLNTTDSPTFDAPTVVGQITFSAFSGSTIGPLAYSASDGVNETQYSATEITFADSTTQSTAAVFFDQSLNTTDSVEFANIEIGAAGSLTFPDSTIQTSAPVYSAATGQSGGSGSTIHHGNYPDEITIVIGGVTYAMPARTI